MNGKGDVIYKHVGPITEDSLKTKLLPVIEKAKTEAAAVPAS